MNPKKKSQPKVRSDIAVISWNRNGGIHRDQFRKSDARQLRRDKSYRQER